MSGSRGRTEGPPDPRWTTERLESARRLEYQGGSENDSDPGGGDEVLRTAHQARPSSEEFVAHEELAPAAPERPFADGVAGRKSYRPVLAEARRYQGWLPTGKLLTAGEVLVAFLVAELVWLILPPVLGVVEGWTEFPEPLIRHPVFSVFLAGAAIGLYVLLRRRSRRLAQRKHLMGER